MDCQAKGPSKINQHGTKDAKSQQNQTKSINQSDNNNNNDYDRKKKKNCKFSKPKKEETLGETLKSTTQKKSNDFKMKI
jgi:hypothetical protein